MAKLTGPLLSFGARGQIGRTLVVSKWKGIPYARQHVVPANPRTTAQQTNRGLFAFLREMFKRAPGAITEAFNAYASGRPLTGMNKFVGENMRILQGAAVVTDMVLSPGARGGLPPVTSSAVTGGAAGEIDVDATAPDPPSGWTLQAAVAVAVPQQDPTGIFAGEIGTVEDAVAPFAATITGLVAGATYVVGIYLRWLKPDGSIAYSASVNYVAAAHA